MEYIVGQVVENALSDYLGELLISITFLLVYFYKEHHKLKKEITMIRTELSMSSDNTRLDEHEQSLQEMRDVLDEFQKSVNDIQKHFEGDKNDPSKVGLLRETHELRSDVREIKIALESIADNRDDLDIDFNDDD